MIQEIHKRTGQGLLQWALSKLEKSLEIPEVSQLVAEYRQFSGKKSSYMQLMEEWAVELEKEEVM